MARTLALMLALVWIGVAFSGCLDFLEDESSDGTPVKRTGKTPPTKPPVQGTMTADLKEETRSGLCPGGGVGVPPGPALYCASRLIWIRGDMDLESLPISLTTFNGAISIDPTATGWNLTVTIEARNADSEQQARARIGNIEFTWSHEDEDGGHFLHAKARQKPNTDTRNTGAQITLVVPEDVVLSGNAVSSNGAVTVHDLACSSLLLTTSNGPVRAEMPGEECTWIIASTSNGPVHVVARTKEVELSTSNGQIVADLVPVASGNWVLSTANGQIALSVPEEESYGYDIDGTTANGEVTISLTDGTLTKNTRTQKHFTTTNFAGRSLQARATLSTANANIDVSPSPSPASLDETSHQAI